MGREISREAAELAKKVGNQAAAEETQSRLEAKPVRGRVMNVSEFVAAEIPEPATLISEVLPGGTVMLVAGQHKVGKTLFGLQMAMAVACGEPWIGFETSMAPVLYLNYEVAEWSFQRRIRRALHGFSGFGDDARIVRSKVGVNLNVVSLPHWRINQATHRKEIRQQVEQVEAQLVIIDPIRAAYTGHRNDDREVDNVMQQLLEEIIVPTGAAVVLLHHMRKPAPGEHGGGSTWEVKGSGSWTDAADGIITMRRDRKDSSGLGRLVNMTLRHFESIDDIRIKLKPASLTFTHEGDRVREVSDLERLHKAFKLALTDGRVGKLSMAEVGDVLGISRQMAQRRFNRGDWPQIEKAETGEKGKGLYRWIEELPPEVIAP